MGQQSTQCRKNCSSPRNRYNLRRIIFKLTEEKKCSWHCNEKSIRHYKIKRRRIRAQKSNKFRVGLRTCFICNATNFVAENKQGITRQSADKHLHSTSKSYLITWIMWIFVPSFGWKAANQKFSKIGSVMLFVIFETLRNTALSNLSFKYGPVLYNSEIQLQQLKWLPNSSFGTSALNLFC